MTWKLTEGALETIMRGGNVDEPVMQILGSKKIAGSGSNERYRLLVSDGRHLNSFAMLATQLNEKLTSGELTDYTIIRINRLITSMINNSGKGDKRVMIILDLTVLQPGNQVGLKLGNPVQFTEGSNDTPSAPASRPVTAVPPPQTMQPKANGFGNQLHARNTLNTTSSPADFSHTHPIDSLSPYQNKWVIKARVTNKSPIRTWSNARGEGKLFSMDLLDESGEIRATAFKEQCDKFYDLIEVNKVYYISKAQLKTANKKFTNLKNDYEMTFTNETQVIPCHEEVGDIPSIRFDFVPLSSIAETEQTIVDLIGVCKTIGPVDTFIARTTNKELKKRELLIVDQSNTGVTLTLWGDQAEEFDDNQQAVIAVKGGSVREFQGAKSISLMSSSVMQINPDIPEAHKLRGWYDNVGMNQEVVNISARSGAGIGSGMPANWMNLRDIRDKQLGSGDKADFCQVKATVLNIRSENCLYMACAGQDCNKKVMDLNNGLYRCEKCNRDYPNFKYRYLVSMCIGDYTSNQWVTCFQDTAELILEKSADEMGAVWSDKQEVQAVANAATFKSYLFKLRVKFETFSDETRLKVVVVGVRSVDFKEYCTQLIQDVKQVNGIN